MNGGRDDHSAGSRVCNFCTWCHPIQYFGIFLAFVAMILVHLGDDIMAKLH